ncbi:MAG: hypothetical protein ACUVTA_02880 [Thermodesulfitimonas sp.]
MRRVKEPVFHAAGIKLPADLKTGVKMARNPRLGQTQVPAGPQKTCGLFSFSGNPNRKELLPDGKTLTKFHLKERS